MRPDLRRLPLMPTFTCTLEGTGPHELLPYCEPPIDVAKVFGTRGRVPVKATVNGVHLEMSLAPMGGCHVLGFNAALARKAGVKVGDRVTITLERDHSPREVAVPADLAKALARDAKAKAAWEKLAPSHKKEHARAIEDAKRPETRARRVASTIEMLVTKGKPDKPKPSEKPLAERLGLKPGMTALVRGAPRGVALEGLADRKAKGAADLLLVFAKDRAAVASAAKDVAKATGSIVWFAYPKTTSGVKTDLTRDVGWDALTKAGFEAVRQVAVDETWSALRFNRTRAR